MTIDELKSLTLEQLRTLAESINLEGYERLKKEYLVEEIINSLEVDKKIEENMEMKIENPETDFIATGILEVMQDGMFGFIRSDNFLPGSKDVYVSQNQLKRFKLLTGDKLKGIARFSLDGQNKFPSLIYVETVNDKKADVTAKRRDFDKLIPIYPNEKLVLEKDSKEFSTRLIDILSPIGKGQRGLIVAQPKVGKTTLLKQIANSITKNNKEVHVMVLLIDERPEEVTDIERSISAEVIHSTFDESPEHHLKVARMVLERAKRLVEQNEDVVILLDSLTRLTRANNLCVEPSGRTLSGGLDPASLYFPKKFFGAARNIENGGSLTILATSLIDTGSKMDDIIFEEFKGTGNMEVLLDRKIAERRIFPAFDLSKTGTRRDDLLLNKDEILVSDYIHRLLQNGNNIELLEKVLNILKKTKDNKEFIKVFKENIINK